MDGEFENWKHSTEGKKNITSKGPFSRWFTKLISHKISTTRLPCKNNCDYNLDNNWIGSYCLMFCALMWGWKASSEWNEKILYKYQ